MLYYKGKFSKYLKAKMVCLEARRVYGANWTEIYEDGSIGCDFSDKGVSYLFKVWARHKDWVSSAGGVHGRVLVTLR